MNRLRAANLDFWFLAVVTVLCLAYPAFDLLGWFDAFPVLKNRIPLLTLLLLSAVSLVLIIERGRRLNTAYRDGQDEVLEHVAREIERAIESRNGVDARFYDGRLPALKELTRRVKAAERSIDVTHFTPSAPPWTNAVEQSYYESYATILAPDKRVRVRRIMLINNADQLQWARDMLATLPVGRFFLAAYPKVSVPIPHITMVIIDSHEVWLTGGERSPAISPKNLAIRHSLVAQLAQDHFDALWRNAHVLNERGVRQDLLQQLEDALNEP